MMRRLLFSVLTCGLVTAGALRAQEDGALLNVAVVRVKADKQLDFEKIQAEMAAASKKADLGRREVWQVVRGRTAEYLIVSSMASFGQNDTPAEVTAMNPADTIRWLSRVWQCIEERREFTNRTALAIPLKNGRKLNLATISFQENLPGMAPQYGEYLQNELIPALKKANVNGLYVRRNVLGLSGPRSWVIVQMLDDWAQLDGDPLATALGHEEASALRVRGDSMLGRIETLLLRYRPELSWSGTN